MNTNYVYLSAQVGEFRQALLYAAGPSSYSQSTGDPVYNPGANEYINFPMQVDTVSGNYSVEFIPSAAGLNIVRAGAPSPSQSGWFARWFYSGVGGAVGIDGIILASAGSGQTNGTYTANASAGGGVIQYVVAGGAVTSVKVINPGTLGFQYTAVPTFTIAAGGTPGTVTAYLGSISGQEVAQGANLSAEIIQFGAVISSL